MGWGRTKEFYELSLASQRKRLRQRADVRTAVRIFASPDFTHSESSGAEIARIATAAFHCASRLLDTYKRYQPAR